MSLFWHWLQPPAGKRRSKQLDEPLPPHKGRLKQALASAKGPAPSSAKASKAASEGAPAVGAKQGKGSVPAALTVKEKRLGSAKLINAEGSAQAILSTHSGQC